MHQQPVAAIYCMPCIVLYWTLVDKIHVGIRPGIQAMYTPALHPRGKIGPTSAALCRVYTRGLGAHFTDANHIPPVRSRSAQLSPPGGLGLPQTSPSQTEWAVCRRCQRQCCNAAQILPNGRETHVYCSRVMVVHVLRVAERAR